MADRRTPHPLATLLALGSHRLPWLHRRIARDVLSQTQVSPNCDVAVPVTNPANFLAGWL
jgi:hypothetical protein